MLDELLKDRTTGENILFATDAYENISTEFGKKCQITSDMLLSGRIKIIPRVEKEFEAQKLRQRIKAEVFTPAWIVNKMNNHCDSEWFGESEQFNHENNTSWTTNKKPIHFRPGLSWEKYVNSRWLEITCGEAPYLVSRYDAVTGEIIPVGGRIGVLDRKLRVVTENTKNEKEWLDWSFQAFKSVYGYEFQGDSLLIARINLLLSFYDYVTLRWGRIVSDDEIIKLTNIITWNIWQMDGLTKMVPFSEPPSSPQFDLFCDNHGLKDYESCRCKTFDWIENTEILFP